MNLGELEDGVSVEDQLLEVLGDNNKEEENAEEVEATMVEARVTLDRADNKNNADNPRPNITFSCDNVSAKLWRSWRRTRTANSSEFTENKLKMVIHAPPRCHL